MDMMSMMAMLATQQGALQSNIAATLMKQNADAREIRRPDAARRRHQPSLANVGAGVGGNLNITA